MFLDPEETTVNSEKLLMIRQGRKSILEYSTEFRLLLAVSDYDKKSALHIYRNGLNNDIKRLIAEKSLSTDFDEFVNSVCILASRVARATPSRPFRPTPHSFYTYTQTPPSFNIPPTQPPPSTPVLPEPMDIDAIRTLPKE
jgi:hypothetical protein